MTAGNPVRSGIPEDVSAEIVAAIRASHLKGSGVEGTDRIVHWDRAFVDPGGTIPFGLGPYAKVPITLLTENGQPIDEITVRVYPPERLRRRLAKLLPASPVVVSGGTAN